MNLALIEKSRKALKPGDIFAMLPPDGAYLFGRVIRTDAFGGGFGPANLIYVYRARSASLERVPVLSKDDLLIPPCIINRLGWSRGYFKVVAHRELQSADLLPVHCFVSNIRSFEEYYDEYGNRLAERTEPWGWAGLGNHRTTDDDVSKALGIPLSPDDP